MSAVAPIESTEVEASRAARVLYEAYSRRVLAYCVTQLRSREEAEDACQQTFLNAFRALQRGVRPHAEAPWLFTIARNVCRDTREAAGVRGRHEATRDLHAIQDVVAAPPAPEVDSSSLAAALDEICPRQRQAIVLREWHGLSYREIATELDLTKTAVETLIFRARRSLAQRLEGQRKTLRGRAADVFSLFSALKTLTAAKVAATAVVAASTAVVAAGPVRERVAGEPDAPRVDRSPAFVRPAAPTADSGRPIVPTRLETRLPAPTSRAGTLRPAATPPVASESLPEAPGSNAPIAPRARQPQEQPTPATPAAPEGQTRPNAPELTLPPVVEEVLPPLPELPQVNDLPLPPVVDEALPELPELPPLP